MTYIKKFEYNKNGNDYIVGDIHGMFTSLYEELKKINFNENKDRLFSVGDLCDRGPESNQILKLLEKKWFYPVMGNHEQILWLYKEGYYSESDLINVGAKWWLTMSQKEQESILSIYKGLPIAIELINSDNKKIGVVHAECPFGDWNLFEPALNSFNSQKFINIALWSTNSPYNEMPIKNIDAVIVGHMAQKKYNMIGNTHLIDTGSGYKGGKLTILKINDLIL